MIRTVSLALCAAANCAAALAGTALAAFAVAYFLGDEPGYVAAALLHLEITAGLVSLGALSAAGLLTRRQPGRTRRTASATLAVAAAYALALCTPTPIDLLGYLTLTAAPFAFAGPRPRLSRPALFSVLLATALLAGALHPAPHWLPSA